MTLPPRKKPAGIYGFSPRSPHFYLSNFFVEPDNTHVEGEYQRAKCAKAMDRKRFDNISPHRAKRLGQDVELRPDWEAVKVEIMEFHVGKKFRDHPHLVEKLKATGTLYLEETNTWGDQFWGVCYGYGQNILGAILMDVRGELL